MIKIPNLSPVNLPPDSMFAARQYNDRRLFAELLEETKRQREFQEETYGSKVYSAEEIGLGWTYGQNGGLESALMDFGNRKRGVLFVFQPTLVTWDTIGANPTISAELLTAGPGNITGSSGTDERKLQYLKRTIIRDAGIDIEISKVVDVMPLTDPLNFQDYILAVPFEITWPIFRVRLLVAGGINAGALKASVMGY